MAGRLAILAALAIAAWGQSKPKDVDGWGKIQWGMTMAQARAVYGISAQPENDDSWALLELPRTRVGGVDMGVQLGARQASGRISFVRLWSTFGLTSSAPASGPEDFDTLKGELTKKYGEPASQEETRGLNFRLLKNAVWKFPSTTIRLSMEQSASIPHLGNVYLEYAEAAR